MTTYFGRIDTCLSQRIRLKWVSCQFCLSRHPWDSICVLLKNTHPIVMRRLDQNVPFWPWMFYWYSWNA